MLQIFHVLSEMCNYLSTGLNAHSDNLLVEFELLFSEHKLFFFLVLHKSHIGKIMLCYFVILIYSDILNLIVINVFLISDTVLF